MFRKFGGVALAASMFVSSTAFAAADANQGALPSGKAASVQQAQMFDDSNGLLWVVGLGIVGGGLALVLTGNGHGTVGTTTNCPLSGCPVPPPPTTTTTSPTTTTTTTS